ncbi:NAD-dependent epimerase/dehydratase family protein [Phycicoccus endophyticus]|uniref:NAD-dependent epimerase/dehydratase family protein n=1 Tax=Phycicoccus endophyticus TaxID=1690220 RepID=A0A7G9R3C8_9MICO|nr:NAD-dependent epimerase/dehydratase family protein [Phycicoccus endophyticus]NHI19853.1 NAD-dependent epimerase/dehydratase family protein [Phycicoccus endophyticus]QNN50103.1 NAD-dependent epimerase/dehydratase family protein [Phycicoccus endophyticus]GGL28005.1 UDP-glucose 4-epimerase [Phycicoccus endophyticus]
MSEPPPLAWVVGAGGLLGRHVVAALAGSGYAVRTSRVPWPEEDATLAVLEADLLRFVADRAGRPWLLAWCAGAGVVATDGARLESERRVFERFTALLGAERDDDGHGVVLLASSAGGVYAGSAGPPFDEDSVPAPLVPYGHTKLAMETVLSAAVARTGSRAVLARLANVYGPGQRLDKPQGLLSQLCLADATRRPVPVFVALDTIRDYLFVADAARMLVRCAALARHEPAGTGVVKVLASGRPVTVGHLVAEARRVLHRPLRTVLAPGRPGQVLDLRLASVRWAEVDALAATPLAAGLAATAADVRERVLARGRPRG